MLQANSQSHPRGIRCDESMALDIASLANSSSGIRFHGVLPKLLTVVSGVTTRTAFLSRATSSHIFQ